MESLFFAPNFEFFSPFPTELPRLSCVCFNYHLVFECVWGGGGGGCEGGHCRQGGREAGLLECLFVNVCVWLCDSHV